MTPLGLLGPASRANGAAAHVSSHKRSSPSDGPIRISRAKAGDPIDIWNDEGGALGAPDAACFHSIDRHAGQREQERTMSKEKRRGDKEARKPKKAKSPFPPAPATFMPKGALTARAASSKKK